MFSLFGKKKATETPTDDPIQGPAAELAKTNGDDFIFVERKTDNEPPGSGNSMYPPIPPYGALPYPPPLGGRIGAPPPPGGAPGSVLSLSGPINYLQDIPFELSPQLMTKDTYNGAQMQVDGILALMTRQLSVDESAEEYTFALERSIQNESY